MSDFKARDRRIRKHITTVPVSVDAVHFIPNLWQRDSDNNLSQMLHQLEGPCRLAGTILDSYDYLLDDEITQTEAIRRLIILRRARSDNKYVNEGDVS